MRVAVVIPCNFINAPYYRRYKKILEKINGCDIDYIIWNKNLSDEQPEKNVICYNEFDIIGKKTFSKIKNFIGFSLFVKRNLEKNKYDKVIILSSVACTAILLYRYLRKKYKKNYWFDIRDKTYEDFKLYYVFMKKVIFNSYYTVISSPKFRDFLPEYPYGIMHNIDADNINNAIILRSNIKEYRKIRISYIGLFGYWKAQKQLIDIFANDEKFILQFAGTNTEIVNQYCKKNNITNVICRGEFSSNRTPYYYQNTDIINNYYGNNDLSVTTALSNKLYYSLALEIPILVSPRTEMERITKKAGNGFTINCDEENIPSLLCEWYQERFKISKNRCKEIYNEKVKENEIVDFKLKEYILNV